KHVEGELTGSVRRLGRRRLEDALDVALAPLTNQRERVTWPDGRRSGDLYGKVVAAAAGVTTIHLTSVDPADDAALARLLAAPTAGGGVSYGAEERA
ncbi:MAG TPA: hypothetical protein VFL90_15155, partial [Methylomirabilota bacterium]|nr:hypothetical protein [Methylomirabilota bacterium]